MSFTNIVESRIDSFENAQQNIFIATPSPLPLLINFWPKLRNEPNQNIGVSRLIKKLMKYETRNCLRPYNNLTLFRMGGRAKRHPPPTSFSFVTSTNLEISPQNVLTFSFNPFPTLV